jgi:hypothetical protein
VVDSKSLVSSYFFQVKWWQAPSRHGIGQPTLLELLLGVHNLLLILLIFFFLLILSLLFLLRGLFGLGFGG